MHQKLLKTQKIKRMSKMSMINQSTKIKIATYKNNQKGKGRGVGNKNSLPLKKKPPAKKSKEQAQKEMNDLQKKKLDEIEKNVR